MTSLLAAPRFAVDDAGYPALGSYAGHTERAGWERVSHRSWLWRQLHHKRWHFVSIAGPRCVTAFVIVDLGWISSAFAYVFDREERRLRADLSFLGAPTVSAHVSPGAGDGARSTFQAPLVGASFLLSRSGDTWTVRGSGPRGYRIEATLDAGGAPPTLCAVAAIEGGVGNCTHKTVGLAARGFVEVEGVRIDLDGHIGGIDHTDGLLARDTRWRWAFATAPGFGLNLVEDFNGPVENALWLDGALHSVGAARFSFDPLRPLEPWTIRTDDGLVDLVFTPEGARKEDKDLLVARSWYIQPIGTFRGKVRTAPGATPREIDGAVGVTEDHLARW